MFVTAVGPLANYYHTNIIMMLHKHHHYIAKKFKFLQIFIGCYFQ